MTESVCTAALLSIIVALLGLDLDFIMLLRCLAQIEPSGPTLRELFPHRNKMRAPAWRLCITSIQQLAHAAIHGTKSNPAASRWENLKGNPVGNPPKNGSFSGKSSIESIDGGVSIATFDYWRICQTMGIRSHLLHVAGS